MFIQPGLFLEQRQKLLLTPELKEALQILQMPLLELNQYLNVALEENPFLELEESKEEEEEAPLESLSELLAQDYSNNSSEYESKENNYDLWEKKQQALPSLQDYLYEQLFAVVKDVEELSIGEFIINSLDNNGYFSEEIDKIVEIMHVEKDKVEKVWQKIKTFEPKGVGAKNLQECLLMQLDASNNHYQLAKGIISHYLLEVSEGKLKEIAKNTKYSLIDIQETIDLIKNLNPRPSNGFRKIEELDYIVPDLEIKKIGDKYQILLNERILPRLIVSPFYRKILQDQAMQKEKTFVEEKFKKALNLLKNIEQRRLTILKIVENTFAEQKKFLDNGLDYLKPLTQKEIAAQVGMHESTVSRVVHGKYCQTPWGVFPLSYFFPSKVSNAQSEEDLTASKIKKVIKYIIDREDKKKPLSDQKIQELLLQENIVLARRTVTKYREEMEIPSSSKRKRY